MTERAESLAEQLFPPAFRAQVEALSLAFSRLKGAAGEGQLSRAGGLGSREFAGHAPYSPGDDLRQLDWAAYWRLGRFYLKTYQREREASLGVMLDLSPSMGAATQPKLRSALRLASAMTSISLRRGIPVMLASPGLNRGRNVSLERPGEMPAAYAALVELAQGERPPGFLSQLGQTSRSLARHMLLITDLLEPLSLAGALGALARGGRRLGVIALLSAQDASPAASGRVRLRSAEPGEPEVELRVTPEVLALYQRELDRHLAGWRRQIAQHRGALEVIRAEDEIDRLLLERIARAGGV